MEMTDDKFILLKVNALLFIALNTSMLQFIELAFVLMHNAARPPGESLAPALL
jgi:hypothetical protein